MLVLVRGCVHFCNHYRFNARKSLSQLLPHGRQAFAVAAPGGVELDEPDGSRLEHFLVEVAVRQDDDVVALDEYDVPGYLGDEGENRGGVEDVASDPWDV